LVTGRYARTRFRVEELTREKVVRGQSWGPEVK